MKYLERYLSRIKDRGNPALSKAIGRTVGDVMAQYTFSFTEHLTGLLMGEVQSGKTSHLFGLLCAAADEGFGNFVLLTTDNVRLQQQTLRRAREDLCDFCICDEMDYITFLQNQMQKPSLTVLKKNTSVLKQWKNNFASTGFCLGNPLFLADDEADAGGLNTLVNQRKESAIHKTLSQMRDTASSSLYLQLSATPQAILLQTLRSGHRPCFSYYFKPGDHYIGGNILFSEEMPPQIVLTDNQEDGQMALEDGLPEQGLKTAVMTHLISSAHLFLCGETLCNCLIHPSMKTETHRQFAQAVVDDLAEIHRTMNTPQGRSSLETVYQNLKKTKESLLPFDSLFDFIDRRLENDGVNVIVINSLSSWEVQYEEGINLIVGGNSLGRGITFPKLQTVYYCRVAKQPRADTMWQHTRMFGYDRDGDIMRVFLPSMLYKLFADINKTNNSIVAQIQKRGGAPLAIRYSSPLKPTRNQVLDQTALQLYSGGVNYFPFYATNESVEAIDHIVKAFSDGEYMVSLHIIAALLEQCGSETDDWNGTDYSAVVRAILAEHPLAQGYLMVRRGRNISRGTGTLLSPADRALGASIDEYVVLTMYHVADKQSDTALWIPNIKFPGDAVYYSPGTGGSQAGGRD